MFNRYRMAASQGEVRLRFAIVVIRESDFLPQPELTVNSAAFVVRNYGGPILDVMSWGFPPPGGKGNVALLGNILQSSWSEALDRPDRRCLVPATQFCEYGKIRGSSDRASDHWLDVPTQPIFAFAGVWQETLGGRVFAILTTSPNAVMDKLSAVLMPLILHEKDHELWLTGSGDEARALTRPFPSDRMASEQL